LPIFPDLSDAQCQRVVQSVLHLVEKNRKTTMVTN
jgi:hypothetical protein